MIASFKDGAYSFKQSDFLGKGTFAKVYKGLITEVNRTVAIRLLPLTLLKKYGDRIKEIINGQVDVLKNISYIHDLNRLFTTHIYDCFKTEHNIVFIMQFCNGGTLGEILEKRKKTEKMSEEQALEIMLQIAYGLEFIAKHKIVHRDLKPDNIFILKKDKYKVYKLGDFGFSVKKELNSDTVGTPLFMSPELVMGIGYSSEVDVWAYGLIFHVLLFNKDYFMEASEKLVKEKVKNVPYQLTKEQMGQISPQTADLLYSCLQANRQKRIDVLKITSHQAFDRVREKIQRMASEINQMNLLQDFALELQIKPKFKVANVLLGYRFLMELALKIKFFHLNVLTDLYLLKFSLGELNNVRQALKQGINIINSPHWDEFKESDKYQLILNMADALVKAVQHEFQALYRTVMPQISKQIGPQGLQGINSNLGNGVYNRISPALFNIEFDNHFKKLDERVPRQQLLMLECRAAKRVIDGSKHKLNFAELQKIKDQSEEDIVRKIKIIQDSISV